MPITVLTDKKTVGQNTPDCREDAGSRPAVAEVAGSTLTSVRFVGRVPRESDSVRPPGGFHVEVQERSGRRSAQYGLDRCNEKQAWRHGVGGGGGSQSYTSIDWCDVDERAIARSSRDTMKHLVEDASL